MSNLIQNIYLIIFLLASTSLYSQSIYHLYTNPEPFDLDFAAHIEAGEDIPKNVESVEGQSILTIDIDENESWKLEISYVELIWNNDFKLFLRNSNFDFLDNPTIKGNDKYKKLTLNPKRLLRGKGPVDDVQIQYELRGLSVLLPAKQYSVEIVYTLVAD